MKQVGGNFDSGCSLEEVAPDFVIYARCVDGKGSTHPCSKGDLGAFAYIRIDVLPEHIRQEIEVVYEVE